MFAEEKETPGAACILINSVVLIPEFLVRVWQHIDIP